MPLIQVKKPGYDSGRKGARCRQELTAFSYALPSRAKGHRFRKDFYALCACHFLKRSRNVGAL
jgi:hypothetical protein